MAEPRLLQLARELEWLGCELEYLGQKHAHLGFPNQGEAWDTFLVKQRGVLVTSDKIERALKDALRFNPSSLVGVEFPVRETLDSLTELMAAVEDIKIATAVAVHDLPTKVRNFTRMVDAYLTAVGAVRR